MLIYNDRYVYNKFNILDIDLYQLYIDAIIVRNEIDNKVHIYDVKTFIYPVEMIEAYVDRTTQIIKIKYLYGLIDTNKYHPKRHLLLHKSFKEVKYSTHSDPEYFTFYIPIKKMKIRLGSIPVEVFKGLDSSEQYH